MHEFLLRAAGWWLGTAVGGGLILLVACLVMRWTRQPAARQRIGEWAVLAALLVAVLRLGPSWLPLPWDAGLARAEALPGDVYEWAVVPRVAPEPVAPMPKSDAPVEPCAIAMAVQLRGTPPPQSLAGPPPHSAPDWNWQALASGVVAAYLAVVGLLLTRWLVGQWALNRLLSQSRPAPFRLRRLFTAMAASTLWPLPGLFQTRRVRMPICFGLRRPSVVIPEAMAKTADDTTLRWVFAHELTHLRRRDLWSYWALGVAQAVFFFVPWFWWLRRQVRLCQEYIADAAAAAEGAAPDEYAAFLVSLAKTPAAPIGAAGLGTSSDLFRRVSMLLQNSTRVQAACPRRWSLAAAGGLFGAAVLFSGLGLRAETPDDGAKEEKKQIVIRLDDGTGDEKDIVIFKHPVGADRAAVIKHVGPMVEVVVDVDNEEQDDAKKPAEKKATARVRLIEAKGGADGKPVIVRVEGDDKPGAKDGEKKVERRAIVIQVPADADAETVKRAVEKALAQAKDQAKLAETEKGKADAEAKKATDAAKKAADQRLRIRADVLKALEAARKAADMDEGANKETVRQALEAARKAYADAAKIEKSNIGETVRKKLAAVEVDKAKIDEAVRKKLAAVEVDKTKIDEAVRKKLAAIDLDKAKIAEDMKRKIEATRKQADDLKKKMVEEGKKPGDEVRKKAVEALKEGGAHVVRSGQGRLGVRVEAPSSAMADQLDLPKDQGLVIAEVVKDSAAAKAGLKANDVLLEINGKTVPSDAAGLAKMLSGMKADESVDALVLRKGKKVAVRGIKLGEGKAGGAVFIDPLDGDMLKKFKIDALPQLKDGQFKIEIDPKQLEGFKKFQLENLPQFKGGEFKLEFDPTQFEGFKKFPLDGLPQIKSGEFKLEIDPKTIVVPILKDGKFEFPMPKVISTPKGAASKDAKSSSQTVSVTVKDGEMTGTIQEGEVKITVKGRVDGGKVNVAEITIEEPGKVAEYKDANEVPEKYRAMVKKLTDNTSGGAIQFRFDKSEDRKKDEEK